MICIDLDDLCNSRLRRHLFAFAGATAGQFHNAIFQPAWTDSDPPRQTNQIHRREFATGALIAVAIVLALAGRDGDGLTLILAGVAVSSFAGAVTALALNFAPNPFAASEIMFWLLGSLADRGFDQLWLALPFMAVGWALMLSSGSTLDALTLGPDAAASLGFDVGRAAVRIVLGAALAVGAATAVAGAIGFIGLVTPHLLRPLVRRRPSALGPASALGGAALLLAADLTARLTPSAEELKLGALTALIGAPFFLYLIYRYRRGLV